LHAYHVINVFPFIYFLPKNFPSSIIINLALARFFVVEYLLYNMNALCQVFNMQLLKEESESETRPTKDFTQESPIIFTGQLDGEEERSRSRTRAIQLSAHRARLLGKEQKTIGAA